jgi:hypothetical protein
MPTTRNRMKNGEMYRYGENRTSQRLRRCRQAERGPDVRLAERRTSWGSGGEESGDAA